MTDKLFFDTDCLSSFLWINQEGILLKLYPGRIILPKQVYNELSNPCIPHINRRYRQESFAHLSYLVMFGDSPPRKQVAESNSRLVPLRG